MKKNSISVFQKFKASVKNVKFLTLGLMGIGGLVMYGAFLIMRSVYPEHPPKYFLYLLLSVSLPWFIAGFIFVIKKRELPAGLYSYKGRPAVIQGVIALVLLSLAEIFSIYILIMGFLGK